MQYPKSSLALAVIAAAGLAGCGGGDVNVGSGASGSGGGGGAGGGGGGGETSRNIATITGDVTDLNDRGAWGSLVLGGYGKVNGTTGENQIVTEASPASVTRFFGGLDNSDSSGTVQFTIIAESGEAFRQDSEVQGITLEGVGSGTTLSNIQVINSDDDGLEWFGGASDVRNLVVQAQTDDGLDQDSGWQGTGKKALVVYGPESGDHGMESDNQGNNADALPKTRPTWTNVTVLGSSGNGDDTTIAALHREGFGGKVFRSVYTDNTSSVAGGSGAFEDGCLDVDTQLDEDLEYGDVVFSCTPQALAASDDNATSFQQQFQDADYQSREGASNGVVSDSVSIDASTLAVNPQTATPSSAFDGEFTTPNGNSVTPAGYFGAVDPAADPADDIPNNGGPFWDGWTYRNGTLPANLPGTNGTDHHPLQAEIENGTIQPASTNQCGDKANVLDQADNVTVFGQSFPVCVISRGDLDGNFTLTNDHIYVLDGTVQVGNGDRLESAQTQEGTIPSSVDQFTLTLEAGTQIFGISDTEPSLVITRGSEIDASGTADQPIIFGGVDAQFK